MSDELVQVWRQRDGSWRWRYVVVDHTELRSNRGYESAEEAVRSARQAYPGVAVLGPVDQSSSVDGERRPEAGVARIALMSASTVFVLLAVWYAVRRMRQPVRGARRSRRRGR
ncbi:MAG TPA: hypothetical protein VGL18_06165 [Actinomycetota bacterium]